MRRTKKTGRTAQPTEASVRQRRLALEFQNPHEVGGAHSNTLEVSIGREVRDFRQKLNITVAELARLARIALAGDAVEDRARHDVRRSRRCNRCRRR